MARSAGWARAAGDRAVRITRNADKQAGKYQSSQGNGATTVAWVLAKSQKTKKPQTNSAAVAKATHTTCPQKVRKKQKRKRASRMRLGCLEPVHAIFEGYVAIKKAICQGGQRR